MHSKLRNSLLGVTAVLAFIVGGAFFGEPLRSSQASAQDAPAAAMSPEARLVFALLTATVSVAQAHAEIEAADAASGDTSATPEADAEPAPSRPVARVRHGKRSLGMPYFSFASVLPRAPQES